MKKKLAYLLALTMTASGMTVPVSAASFSDTDDHWAESAIERWEAYDVVQGSDGKFNPNNDMTRAELATVISRLLGLTEKAENTFSDVSDDAWYADSILKCAAAGIMQGNGVGANPNGTVTRQEATVMLARALGIEPVSGEAGFNDSGNVADWAAGYVKAMTDKGIINGVGDNSFAPTADINRASVVTILDKSISTYANKAGESVQASGSGITLITAQ
jgi:hypothetical protein